MNTATALKKLSLSVAVTASTVVAGLTALPASASSFTGTGSGFSIPNNILNWRSKIQIRL